jgi:hypothetical protein
VRRRGAGATDRWGWAAMEPDGQRWGAGESERESEAARQWAPTCGPGQHSEFNDIHRFKRIQKPPNFDRFEKYLPVLQKFEIKYGWKEYEMGKSFDYRNFLIFLLDLEQKFREISMS